MDLPFWRQSPPFLTNQLVRRPHSCGSLLLAKSLLCNQPFIQLAVCIHNFSVSQSAFATCIVSRCVCAIPTLFHKCLVSFVLWFQFCRNALLVVFLFTSAVGSLSVSNVYRKSADLFTPRVEGLASRIMRPAHNQSRLFAAGAKSDEDIIEEEKRGATAAL